MVCLWAWINFNFTSETKRKHQTVKIQIYPTVCSLDLLATLSLLVFAFGDCKNKKVPHVSFRRFTFDSIILLEFLFTWISTVGSVNEYRRSPIRLNESRQPLQLSTWWVIWLPGSSLSGGGRGATALGAKLNQDSSARQKLKQPLQWPRPAGWEINTYLISKPQTGPFVLLSWASTICFYCMQIYLVLVWGWQLLNIFSLS